MKLIMSLEQSGIGTVEAIQQPGIDKGDAGLAPLSSVLTTHEADRVP